MAKIGGERRRKGHDAEASPSPPFPFSSVAVPA
jgi:hypothetical protein